MQRLKLLTHMMLSQYCTIVQVKTYDSSNHKAVSMDSGLVMQHIVQKKHGTGHDQNALV